MRRKLLCFYISICLCCVAAAEQKKSAHIIDSLTTVASGQKEDSNKVNTLTILSDKLYRSGDKDKAMQCGLDALGLAHKVHYKRGEANAFRCIATVYYSKLKYPEALQNYQLGLKIEEQLRDTFNTALFYTRIGLVYFRQANLPEALQADLTSLKLREAVKDSAGMSTTYINLGNVYSEQNNYTEALKNEKMALGISVRFKQENNTAAALNNLGGIEVKMKQYDSALAYFKKAMDLEEKIGDEEGVSIVYDNMGEIYMDQGKYKDALDYTARSLALKRKIGYFRGVEAVYIHFADIYNLQKQFAKAKLYADTGLKMSNESGSKDYIQSGYANLARADSGLGDYKAALANYQLSVSWHDSLINDANTKKTMQAEMNYEFDKKQQLLKAEQDKKDAIAQDASKRQRLIIFFALAIALVIAFIAIYIFRSLRITRSQKSVIEEQKILVEHQKAIVDEKNKDITDSIKYASRIQTALLTTHEYINKYLKEYFILLKPRDIVSGDFYWAYKAQAPLNPPKGGNPEEFGYETADPILYGRLKEFVSENRSKPTEAENAFWQLVRGKKLDGYKFRRQHIIGHYIADFVCLSNKLIIEIDGLIHQLPGNIESDLERTEYLNQQGFTVLRFTNDEVIGNGEKIIERIVKEFQQSQQIPPSGAGGAFYIACCDCTGHGVPGAFMSVLNISMLNESVLERNINRPDFILNDVRTSIIKALNPDGSDSGKDGMDCSLCMIDLKNNILQASCANNPVWIIRAAPLPPKGGIKGEYPTSSSFPPLEGSREAEFIEIQPDKMPVGIQHGEQKSFKLHTISLKKGDSIYMFTDGYADQFGGARGKKFKYKALQELLVANVQKTMSEQQAILDKTFETWKGELEQVDDVLIIGVKV